MKRTLTSVAAAAMALGMLVPTTFAATTNSSSALTNAGAKSISLDGTTLYSGVLAGNAADAGSVTTYFPIWYLEQALTKAGYTTSYNPSTATWDITMPGVDATQVKVDGGVGSGNAAISINGTVVKKFNAKWNKDLAGGANANVTTYFPLYYLSNVLKATGFSNAWDGFNFAFTKSVAAPFAVKSVSALNAKQLQVTFSQPVDTTTAQTVANYGVASAAGVTNAVTNATVQPDGKTVVLTLTSAYATSTDVNVTVGNVLLKGSTSQVVPFFSTAVTVNDTTPASVTKISSSTSGATASKVSVTFSEPVASATFKIDGSYSGSVAWSSNNTVATISGLSLDSTKSHTLDAVTVTDYANNVTSILGQSFSITKDTVAPTVSSVTALNDHQFEVVFSKQMDNLGDAGDPTTAGNIVVKDETLTNLTNAPTVAADTNDTTGTHYIVTIPSTDALYTTKSSRTLTVLFSSAIEDSLTNAMSTATQAVTLSKDTVAPSVTSVTYKTNPAGSVTDVVLNLSEGAMPYGSGVSSSGITVVDPNGVQQASFLPAASQTVAAGDTSVDFHFATAKSLSGTYTFYLPAGLITDNSQAANQSGAVTLQANFGTGSSTGTFSLPSSPLINPSNDVIKIDFGSGVTVKGGAVAGSATNTSDYTLDGSPLPAGTVISLDSTKEFATITLPANSIATDDSHAIFTITGVQNAAGQTVTPYTGQTAIVANEGPVLKSAQVIGNTVVLTYNENVANDTIADATTAYSLTVNGVALNLGTSGTLSAAPQVGSSNQVVLTVTPGAGSNWSTTLPVTVTTKGANVTDTQTLSNVQQANVTVTASH